MQKRLFGVLIGLALLTTLCMNVLAAYADNSPIESATELAVPLVDDRLQADSLTPAADSTSELTVPHPESDFSIVNLLNQSQDTPALPASTVAAPVGPQLIVNGTPLPNPDTSKVSETTYIPLRTIISALDPNASITWESNQLVAVGQGFRLTARPGDLYLMINDRYLYVPDGILMEDNATLAPLRTICTALGANTQWDFATQNITVQTTTQPLLSGTSHYNQDDLYWMSRIISAESNNQPLKGKIGVGTVIMNRVESPQFPNTIKDVIFSGQQFSPVQNGSIYKTPSEESVLAAKLVLDGAREAGDSLFFNRAGLNCWAARNKTHVTTIADHSFFA